MLLVVDNGSAYTKHLVGFLNETYVSFEKQTPDSLDLEHLNNFDSFILSGRRHDDKKTNSLNSKVILHAVRTDKKLLGICYGAEILALVLGGTIRRSPIPQQGAEKVTVHEANPLCTNEVCVFESHRFEVSVLPKELVSLAKSASCKHELIRYDNKLIFGTQFHPEMSADGRRLVKKFCSL